MAHLIVHVLRRTRGPSPSGPGRWLLRRSDYGEEPSSAVLFKTVIIHAIWRSAQARGEAGSVAT